MLGGEAGWFAPAAACVYDDLVRRWVTLKELQDGLGGGHGPEAENDCGGVTGDEALVAQKGVVGRKDELAVVWPVAYA